MNNDETNASQKLHALEQRITELYSIVGQVAAMNTVGNVLENGFEALSARIEPLEAFSAYIAPLRDLAPRRTHMSIDGHKRLRNLREATARPKWSGAGSLSVAEMRVPFIGEIAPPDRTHTHVRPTGIFAFVAEASAPATRSEESDPEGGTSS